MIKAFFIGTIFISCALLSCHRSANKQIEKQNEPVITTIDTLFEKALKMAGKDIQLSRIFLEKGHELFPPKAPSSIKGKYHQVKGRVFYYEDQYVESTIQLDSAISLFSAENEFFELGLTYYFHAATNALIGNSAKAIESAHKAIEMFGKIGDQKYLADVNQFLGSMYIDQNDLTLALDYLEIAKNQAMNDSLSLTYGNILANIGKVYSLKNNLEEAEKYYQQAYETRLKCADIRHIASSLYMLANLRINQGRFREAIPFLEDAEEIYKELEEKTGLFLVYHAYACIYNDIHEYDQAYQDGETAMELAESMDNIRHKAKAVKIMQEIAEGRKDIGESLNYLKAYLDLHDQLVSVEKSRLITKIEHKNEMEKQSRDNEILRQETKLREQQTKFLAFLALILLILLIALAFLIRMRKQNFLNKQQLLENEMKMTEASSQIHEKEKIILANNLELKNKELAGKTLELLNQIETLQALAERVDILEDSNSKKEIEGLLKELKIKTRENVWDEFHTAFNNVHKEFYDKLFSICPDLTSTEIKIAALLKLNLSSKEIAAISNKSESAVTTARHRLRQKLNLTSGDNLINFLMKI